MGKEQVKNDLDKVDDFISAGPNEIHSQVLEELAEVLAEMLSVRVQGGPEERKTANTGPILKNKKKRRKRRAEARQLWIWTSRSNLNKTPVHFIKESLVMHLDDYKAKDNGQNGCIESELFITQLLAFSDRWWAVWMGAGEQWMQCNLGFMSRMKLSRGYRRSRDPSFPFTLENCIFAQPNTTKAEIAPPAVGSCCAFSRSWKNASFCVFYMEIFCFVLPVD